MATIHDILKNESEFREQQAENIRFMAGAIERIRIAVGLNEGELFTTYAVAVEEAVIERDTLRATVSDLRDVCKTWEATAASDIKQINKLYADIAALEKGVDEMRNWGSERAILQARVAELEAEVERLKVRDLEWTTILPGCAYPDDLAESVRGVLAGAEREVELLKAAMVGLRSFIPSTYEVPQSPETLAEIGSDLAPQEPSPTADKSRDFASVLVAYIRELEMEREKGWTEAERTQLRQELAEARAEVERLKALSDALCFEQESSPAADAPSQERATGCAGSAPATGLETHEAEPAQPGVEHYTYTIARLPNVLSRLHWVLSELPKQTKTLEVSVPVSLLREAAGAIEGNAAQNALTAIRWALADLGLDVKQDPEATSSAVELLCVQLRREGRAWTGESLGALTSPAMMQTEDNAALRQRVYSTLGGHIIRTCNAGLQTGYLPDPGLVAQFDLLGRDL